MVWVKKGFIYKPSGEGGWMNSHAQLPTALLMEDRIRIYINVRPKPGLTRPTYIDVDIKDPTKILYVHKEPLLELGPRGAHDEFGFLLTHVMRVEDEVWIYLSCFKKEVSVPHSNSIGLAISKDGGSTFYKPFPGPLTATTRFESYSALAPCVMREGNKWHMWYGSGTGWLEQHGKMEQLYCLYYAHSDNGLDWVRPNICAIPAHDNEGISRACVRKEGDIYEMYYSYRGTDNYRDGGEASYRIGYATSKDAMNWVRQDDKVTLLRSESGWDSEMIGYTNILDTPHGRYMFYNGNGFGESGFGYAVWQ